MFLGWKLNRCQHGGGGGGRHHCVTVVYRFLKETWGKHVGWRFLSWGGDTALTSLKWCAILTHTQTHILSNQTRDSADRFPDTLSKLRWCHTDTSVTCSPSATSSDIIKWKRLFFFVLLLLRLQAPLCWKSDGSYCQVQPWVACCGCCGLFDSFFSLLVLKTCFFGRKTFTVF